MSKVQLKTQLPIRHTWLLVLFGVLISLPPFLGLYTSYLFSLSLIYLITAYGLNLVLGYAGQISLAQGAFMGVGAYTVAILTAKGISFWLSLPLGGAITFIMGAILGFPALKVKHHYLAMVTLGFNVIIYEMLLHGGRFTGGPYGIPNIPRPTLGPISFRSDLGYSYLIAGVALLLISMMYWVLNSRWGRAFKAIRENEVRAVMLGIHLRHYKLAAFAIGSCYAGIAGGLLAPLLGYIDPTSFDIRYSFDFLLIVIIGGSGRFEGPLIGVPIIILLPELLRITQMMSLIIFSALAILVLLFMPRGGVLLWDSSFKLVTRRKAPQLTK